MLHQFEWTCFSVDPSPASTLSYTNSNCNILEMLFSLDFDFSGEFLVTKNVYLSRQLNARIQK